MKSLSEFFRRSSKRDSTKGRPAHDRHDYHDHQSSSSQGKGSFWGHIKNRLSSTMHLTPAPRIPARRRQRIILLLWAYVREAARQRNVAIKEAARSAAYCIEDAFLGHLSNGLASNSKKSETMLTIFRFQTSSSFRTVILLASCVHSVCVFYEGSGATTGTLPPAAALAINVLVLLLYAVDVGLKMAYEGVNVGACPCALMIRVSVTWHCAVCHFLGTDHVLTRTCMHPIPVCSCYL